jgi:hypothetical protein
MLNVGTANRLIYMHAWAGGALKEGPRASALDYCNKFIADIIVQCPTTSFKTE